MAIIGSMIKGLLEVRDTLTDNPNPVDAQTKVLRSLLNKAKDTAFGRHYKFEKLLEAKDIRSAFAEQVPYFDYYELFDKWWSRLLDGQSDITWPGKPGYYAVSAGTTGSTNKHIPVTEDMIDAIRQTGIKQIGALVNFDLPADFFEKEIMMLGSSTDLKTKGERKEGEISGISASNIPFWFRGYYKPGEEIANITDWDTRVKAIAENAEKWDIGALSGIPSWIELALKEVIAHHGLAHIHEIWPNLQVYASGGISFQPYEKSFNDLLGRPVTVIDTYLASEGFIAYQERPQTDAMKLVLDDSIYFEFVPFEQRYIKPDGSLEQAAPVLMIEEVKENVDYVLLISTASGAWRYMIGDTVAFTDKERCEIKITGRTKFFLNVVGSKLTVHLMDQAIRHIEEVFDIKIPEYTVCAKRTKGEYFHHWYLGTKSSSADDEKFSQAIDEYLKEAHKSYRVARKKALKGVKAKAIPLDVFYEWNAANKKKGGQVKMERVMEEEKFEQWEKFAAENS